MLTALISAVTGLFSGAVPEIIKEVRDSRAHAREVEFLRVNQELALQRAQYEASVKIEEARSNAMLADVQRSLPVDSRRVATAERKTHSRAPGTTGGGRSSLPWR